MILHVSDTLRIAKYVFSSKKLLGCSVSLSYVVCAMLGFVLNCCFLRMCFVNADYDALYCNVLIYIPNIYNLSIKWFKPRDKDYKKLSNHLTVNAVLFLLLV